MICREDVLEMLNALEGTVRVGDPSKEEKVRKILKRICDRASSINEDQSYDSGFDDGYRKAIKDLREKK